MGNKAPLNSTKCSIKSFAILLFILIIALGTGAITLKLSIKVADLAEVNKSSESARIALSYVNMMVKQNDSKGNIRSAEPELGLNGMIIDNYMGEEDLSIAVYFEDGTLYECLYSETFDKTLSEKVVDIEYVEFSVGKNDLHIEVTYGKKSLLKYIHFRTSGGKGGNDG